MVNPSMPGILGLDAPMAVDGALTGAKASNLARCGRVGLPVLPGFVITTVGQTLLGDPAFDRELRGAWERFVENLPSADPILVVRSSSTAEDLESSSMAGRFQTVLDVSGWEAFRDAVDVVIRSAKRVADSDGAHRPMAVLVQTQLDVRIGGVLFGLDPVTGQREHLVVEVVPSRVDHLVSGEVTAAHYVLTNRGRTVDTTHRDLAPPLGRSLRRRLARLAHDAQAALGPAQDIEWAVDGADRLWLLQSRPVTAANRPGQARVFGPGPVAETFPQPLRRLECDLWVEPLRDGIARALRASGVVSERLLCSSPLLTTIGGRVAIDLELIGVATGEGNFRQRYGPAQIVRRVLGSWRIDRLRVALPRLVESVLDSVDTDLAAIPPIDELDAAVVLDLIDRARRELATVHQYEVLAGMLLSREGSGVPAGLVALDVLHRCRAVGMGDAEVVARHPVVLALTAPCLSGWELPAALPDQMWDSDGIGALDEREALRLRARWIQELLAAAVGSLAHRLVREGAIDRAGLVCEMDLGELKAAIDGVVPDHLEARARGIDGPPLPARFRLTPSGGVLPMGAPHGQSTGLPASAGHVVGVAGDRVTPGAPRDGTILVIGNLDPGLAPLLPSIDGLVAETGSALSHLAILARELGIPAVVGVPDARRRFPPGTALILDGDSGDVHRLESVEARQATEVRS